VGQSVNPLIFKSGISSFWKIKNYPSNLRINIIKNFNIYNIVYSYLKKLGIEIIIYKSYINNYYFKVYIFFYFLKRRYEKIYFQSLNYLFYKHELTFNLKKIELFNTIAALKMNGDNYLAEFSTFKCSKSKYKKKWSKSIAYKRYKHRYKKKLFRFSAFKLYKSRYKKKLFNFSAFKGYQYRYMKKWSKFSSVKRYKKNSFKFFLFKDYKAKHKKKPYKFSINYCRVLKKKKSIINILIATQKIIFKDFNYKCLLSILQLVLNKQLNNVVNQKFKKLTLSKKNAISMEIIITWFFKDLKMLLTKIILKRNHDVWFYNLNKTFRLSFKLKKILFNFFKFLTDLYKPLFNNYKLTRLKYTPKLAFINVVAFNNIMRFRRLSKYKTMYKFKQYNKKNIFNKFTLSEGKNLFITAVNSRVFIALVLKYKKHILKLRKSISIKKKLLIYKQLNRV
jgi:hypothetical protein